VPALPHSLSVLRQREYRLLFGGQLVSLLGDQMVNVALAFGVMPAPVAEPAGARSA
jgi:hypothetical protein